MRANPQLRRRFDVLFAIICEEKSLRRLAGRRDRRIVDLAVGFHRIALRARRSCGRSSPERRIPRDEVGVGFVGIGYENERITGFQTGQELLRHDQARQENRGPCLVKLLETHLELSVLAKIAMVFVGRDVAVLVRPNPGLVEDNGFEFLARHRDVLAAKRFIPRSKSKSTSTFPRSKSNASIATVGS